MYGNGSFTAPEAHAVLHEVSACGWWSIGESCDGSRAEEAWIRIVLRITTHYAIEKRGDVSASGHSSP